MNANEMTKKIHVELTTSAKIKELRKIMETLPDFARGAIEKEINSLSIREKAENDIMSAEKTNPLLADIMRDYYGFSGKSVRPDFRACAVWFLEHYSNLEKRDFLRKAATFSLEFAQYCRDAVSWEKKKQSVFCILSDSEIESIRAERKHGKKQEKPESVAA